MALFKALKTIRIRLIKLLQAYSPLAMAILIIPFFLPIDRHLHRTLLILFSALPAIALTALRPGTFFKKPVLLSLALFAAYFSAQEIRGMLPLETGVIRQVLTLAAMVVFPAIMLSEVKPEQKLYPIVIRLIFVIAAIRLSMALVHFYADAPFPAARFDDLGHPVSSSRIMGFAAVLAGALFMKDGSTLKRWDWLAMACIPILLLAMLYTHTRSTALALLAVAALALFGMKKRMKKTLILYSLLAVSFFIYLATVCPGPACNNSVQAASLFSLPTAPAPCKPKVSQPASAAPCKSKTQCIRDIRSKGIFSTGEQQTCSIFSRLDIWKDHLSRMTSTKLWLIGHGLGMKAFETNPQPAAAQWYYPTPNGYTLLPHSGFVWTFYHGGLIGLATLLLLLITALWSAFRAGPAGYVALALILFNATCMLVDCQRLLIGRGPDYLTFWIPLGLAAAFSRFPAKKKA